MNENPTDIRKISIFYHCNTVTFTTEITDYCGIKKRHKYYFIHKHTIKMSGCIYWHPKLLSEMWQDSIDSMLCEQERWSLYDYRISRFSVWTLDCWRWIQSICYLILTVFRHHWIAGLVVNRLMLWFYGWSSDKPRPLFTKRHMSCGYRNPYYKPDDHLKFIWESLYQKHGIFSVNKGLGDSGLRIESQELMIQIFKER